MVPSSWWVFRFWSCVLYITAVNPQLIHSSNITLQTTNEVYPWSTVDTVGRPNDIEDSFILRTSLHMSAATVTIIDVATGAHVSTEIASFGGWVTGGDGVSRLRNEPAGRP